MDIIEGNQKVVDVFWFSSVNVALAFEHPIEFKKELMKARQIAIVMLEDIITKTRKCYIGLSGDESEEESIRKIIRWGVPFSYCDANILAKFLRNDKLDKQKEK